MVWKSALFINHSAQSVSRGELNEHFRNIYKNVRPVAEIIFSIYLVVCTDRTFTGYMHVCVLLLQQCPSLCNPMDYNPPGSFIHGILQAGILEWVAGPSSRGSSRPRDQTCISSVQFSHSVVSNSLRPHESQHARPPCPSPTPGVHSDSCPSSQ